LVGRDETGGELLGQLDVEGVDQTEVAAPPPCAEEQGSEEVSFDGCGGERFEPGTHLGSREAIVSLEPSESREHLGVEMGGHMEVVAVETFADRIPEFTGE
jgi:hypothetical protein